MISRESIDVNYHDAAQWAMRLCKERCQIVGSVRHGLAEKADALIAAARNDQRTDDVETIASELIPLADAIDWIRRKGASTLKTRKVGLAGRPIWMFGVRSIVQRAPLGRVLVLGTWNYPLFLTGVQVAQALAAGNSVWVKPAPGAEAVTEQLIALFHEAGVPAQSLQVLGSDPQSAIDAMSGSGGRVDLVVLTGSAATGRKVLHQAADGVASAIMELSGVDAVVAMPGSNWQRLVAAVQFGLMFNSGATCIGPRRLIFESQDSDSRSAVEVKLVEQLKSRSAVIVHPAARPGVVAAVQGAIDDGGVDLVGKFDAHRVLTDGKMFPVVLSQVPPDHPILKTDLFAPVITLMPVASIELAVDHINECPYRLAASVFGPKKAAIVLANRLSVGCVTVNDMVAPTADPRLPFGGRGESGFGVTRGPEGLLAMTTPQVIATRLSRFAPHLSPRHDSDAAVLQSALQIKHGRGLRQRVAAMARATTAARAGGGLKQGTVGTGESAAESTVATTSESQPPNA